MTMYECGDGVELSEDDMPSALFAENDIPSPEYLKEIEDMFVSTKKLTPGTYVLGPPKYVGSIQKRTLMPVEKIQDKQVTRVR